ncbi:MAG: hypothetical protein EBQ87_13255 [Planctomycetes bacterium]|nr:hypothetical protein [Planctomycetota bacterium]
MRQAKIISAYHTIHELLTALSKTSNTRGKKSLFKKPLVLCVFLNWNLWPAKMKTRRSQDHIPIMYPQTISDTSKRPNRNYKMQWIVMF